MTFKKQKYCPKQGIKATLAYENKIVVVVTCFFHAWNSIR